MKRQRASFANEVDRSHISPIIEEYDEQLKEYMEKYKAACDALHELETSSLQQKQTLEKQLEDEKRATSQLRIENLYLRQQSNESAKYPPSDKVDKEIDALKREMVVLNKRVNVSEPKAIEFDKYRGKGFFDEKNEQILHLQDNPYKKARLMSVSLVKKEAELPLQTPRKQSPGDGIASSYEDPAKKYIRLKEQFAKQSHLFRDIIFQLTGWNITMDFETMRISLKSRYAENANDSIELNMKGTDDFELLQTPFVSSLDERLLSYLNVSNSYPAFLSAVCVDLFGKQTTFLPPM